MNPGSETRNEPKDLIDALRPVALAQGVWTACDYRKGQMVFGLGDAADAVFVLKSGLVKLSFGTQDGQEWVKSFVCDEGVFAAQDAGSPASYGATCLEPSRLIRVPMVLVTRALTSNEALQKAFLAFSAWLLRNKQAREAMLLGVSPEAQYCRLLADRPDLVARLPQGDIARYLGITPVGFSRIKRRLAGNQTGGISPSARPA